MKKRKKIMKKKNPTTKEFNTLFSGITIKDTASGLSSYLNKSEIPNKLPCFRVGIRDNKGSVVSAKIFDNDLNLIKEVSLN